MLESAKGASRRDLAVRRQTASGEVVHGGSGLRALGTACWPPESGSISCDVLAFLDSMLLTGIS